MVNVLVTGATGFVGRHIVKTLKERDYRVVCPVRNKEKALSILGSDVFIEWVDFSDINSIRNLLEETSPDVVIHLIGILQEIRSKGITFERVHHEYTKNLCEACKGLPIKKIVYMSALGTSDNAPSRYHKTKYLAEKEIMESGFTYTILRPSIILGPEQRLFSDMDNLTRFLRVILLPDANSYHFQPVYIEDLVCAVLRSMETETTDNKIYEVCGPDRVTMKDILDYFFSYINRKVFVLSAPKRFMYLLGKVAEFFLEPPPFSSDQILMMWKENICTGEDCQAFDFEKICGRPAIGFKEAMERSLMGYHKLR